MRSGGTGHEPAPQEVQATGVRTRAFAEDDAGFARKIPGHERAFVNGAET
jgi:hypothetical protein